MFERLLYVDKFSQIIDVKTFQKKIKNVKKRLKNVAKIKKRL